jgi:gluconolactonase
MVSKRSKACNCASLLFIVSEFAQKYKDQGLGIGIFSCKFKSETSGSFISQRTNPSKPMRSAISFILIALFFSCSDKNRTSIVAKGAQLELVSDAYSFTEGPAVDPEGNVYFTDQPNNQILKWSVDNGDVEVFMKPAGRANGLYFDNQGKLLAAADEKFELWRIDVTGEKETEVLLSQFDGKNLNGPNDIWVDPKGGIYFTDPYYQRPWWDRQAREIEQERVYYLPEGSREPIIVVDDFVQPNGIIGSPDGKKLYIADIGDSKTYSFDIQDNGLLTNKTLLAEMGSDGMTLDDQGNVYLTGDGVTVFSPVGKKVLHIPVPQDWTANVTFGGKEQGTLFITAMNSLYTLEMNVHGVR